MREAKTIGLPCHIWKPSCLLPLTLGAQGREVVRDGGNDRIRTYDLALMKRPLCR